METKHSIVAGALYDFLGYITTLDPPMAIGQGEQPHQLIKRLEEWATKRNLDLGSADVHRWHNRLSEPDNPEAQAVFDSTFCKNLAQVLNTHSIENGSNTPDFILAHVVAMVLHAWNTGVMRREAWYGRPFTQGVIATGSVPGDLPNAVTPRNGV